LPPTTRFLPGLAPRSVLTMWARNLPVVEERLGQPLVWELVLEGRHRFPLPALDEARHDVRVLLRDRVPLPLVPRAAKPHRQDSEHRLWGDLVLPRTFHRFLLATGIARD